MSDDSMVPVVYVRALFSEVERNDRLKTPRVKTNLGVAKAILPALVLVYVVPIFKSVHGADESIDYLWRTAHFLLSLGWHISVAGLRFRTYESSE